MHSYYSIQNRASINVTLFPSMTHDERMCDMFKHGLSVCFCIHSGVFDLKIFGSPLCHTDHQDVSKHDCCYNIKPNMQTCKHYMV